MIISLLVPGRCTPHHPGLGLSRARKTIAEPPIAKPDTRLLPSKIGLLVPLMHLYTECPLPTDGVLIPGDSWRCECGRYWFALLAGGSVTECQWSTTSDGKLPDSRGDMHVWVR